MSDVTEQLHELELQIATMQAQLKMCENILRASALMLGAMLGIDVSVYM